MNQSVEGQQDCKENRTRKKPDRKKRVILAVAAAVLALLVIPVVAWLYIQRSMETMTKINEPHILSIKAGDMQDIEQLELGTIDVSGEQKYKDVVFCVYSERPSKSYDLQLAHTTNIGFTYEIYTATRADTNASTDVVECLGKQYAKGVKLSGSYLNIYENNRYATNAYHGETYGEYEKVQKSAEPLYWKTSIQVTLPDREDYTGYYVNYYILHITWGDDVQNNKETDMIYLMAG